MAVRLLLLLLAAGATSRPWTDPLTPAAFSEGTADLAAHAAAPLVGWLLLALLAARVARLPGWLGGTARAVLALLLPRALRAGLLALVGTQALVGVAGAAGPAADGGEAALPSPSVAALAVGRPVPVPGSLALPAPAPAAAALPAVVVGPGDTLWGLAAAHLPVDSPASAVAAAWPEWYEANREAIGPDPDRVAVGLVLRVPLGTAGVTR